MANKYIERCLTLLVTSKMQIKTTTKYHYTATIKAKIKKTDNTKSWPRGRVMRTLKRFW